MSANGMIDNTLCLTRAEAGTGNGHQIRLVAAMPLLEVAVNTLSKLLATGHSNDTQISEQWFFHVTHPPKFLKISQSDLSFY
jgi:hypothetical protein